MNKKFICVHLFCFLSLQKEIRSSLVLSMLQQMLAEDKADMVREAVVKSLGIIMGYIDDPDKYSQVCVLCEGSVYNIKCFTFCFCKCLLVNPPLTRIIVCIFQGFELMLLSLGDPSERVVSAVHQVFIPAFAAWTTELGTLQSALIPSLLARIEKLLMVSACLKPESLSHPILIVKITLVEPKTSK